MKTFPSALLIAAVTLASLPALAQRLPRGAERDTITRKHLAECEVCAKLDAGIKEAEAELADLQQQKDDLRLKRLEQMIEDLADRYPDATEQLDQLLLLRKKMAELQKEVRDIIATGGEILQELELDPQDRAALTRALLPAQQPAPGGPRIVHLKAQKARLARAKDDNPEMAKRIARAEAEHKKRLKELKKNDPELYELTVKEEALAQKLGDLRISLRQTMMEHLRNAAQPN